MGNAKAINIAFRPYNGDDAEEKIESNALHNALKKLIPENEINIIGRRTPEGTTHRFGRSNSIDTLPIASLIYPGERYQATNARYWDWPTFIDHANRFVKVAPYEEAKDIVATIHEAGNHAFVKSTRQKHFIQKVPRGTSLNQAIGDWAYDLIDGGPNLIVQDFATIVAEYRIFIIDGEVITGAGKIMEHTPADHRPCDFGPFSRFTPSPDGEAVDNPDLVKRYIDLARSIASCLPDRHTNIDVALINGRVGIVEANPLELGQIGLFGCDIDILTRATLKSLEIIE